MYANDFCAETVCNGCTIISITISFFYIKNAFIQEVLLVSKNINLVHTHLSRPIIDFTATLQQKLQQAYTRPILVKLYLQNLRSVTN